MSKMNNTELLTINEASDWATKYLKKKVSPSNISYLIQYGKVKKIFDGENTKIQKDDLKNYYDSFNGKREIDWKSKLGEDLNWALSFDHVKESETTKHVHRLHPYKGKFIPQLVEYFLDDHVDKFKTEVVFRPGDIVLDPFCGSGTTLVEANELGINAIGIDISIFNSLISKCKIQKYDLPSVYSEIRRITNALKEFIYYSKIAEFEAALLEELNIFNSKYFPSPEYKYQVLKRDINPDVYGHEKELIFLPKYYDLITKYQIDIEFPETGNFIDRWFFPSVKKEIYFVYDEIKKINDQSTKEILSLILSRTMRSCRATTHSDLATLKEPQTTTYYCPKHSKICKPLFSILKWWDTYTKDSIKRLAEFDTIRTDTMQVSLVGDSRNINIIDEVMKLNPNFGKKISEQKIKGIFSSPPYVGMIDYHEQHAYAYDLFGFDRHDSLEIGPLYKGQGESAKQSYVEGISEVLINCEKYLSNDYDIFLVANDKYDLYPQIVNKSGMKIIKRYKRPVLNRTERDKGAYSEVIFHIKKDL
jgi:hypothetical protein